MSFCPVIPDSLILEGGISQSNFVPVQVDYDFGYSIVGSDRADENLAVSAGTVEHPNKSKANLRSAR